jgi:hypothetical protein
MWGKYFSQHEPGEQTHWSVLPLLQAMRRTEDLVGFTRTIEQLVDIPTKPLGCVRLFLDLRDKIGIIKTKWPSWIRGLIIDKSCC